MTAPLRPTKVLVVDDEPKIRDLARRYLVADGFDVREAPDGAGALVELAAYEPDIIVLDVMMPILNGLDVLRRIRTTSTIPVVLLTARDDEIDIVVGLTAGADDYVTKPFGGRELAARLHAILRRIEPSPAISAPAISAPAISAPPAPSPATPAPSSLSISGEHVLSFDAVTIDVGRRLITTLAGPAETTATDFDLFLALARSPGQVLTWRQLITAVWNDDAYTDDRVVDVHIRTLRRALRDDATQPTIIDTVRSVGYRFLPSPMPAHQMVALATDQD